MLSRVPGAISRSFRLSILYIAVYIYVETEMATCSSVLAWRIPGMGARGGLPSMGSDTELHMIEAT